LFNKVTTDPILIKFTTFEFAKRLRDGEIYMNPLAYFRGVEDGNVKGDLYEGTDSIIANDDFDRILPSLGLDLSEQFKKHTIGGISLLSEEQKYCKVFCMYLLNYDFRNSFIESIDKKIKDFGDTFVLITDFGEFRNRIIQRLNTGSYNIQGFKGSKVEYYKFEMPTGKLGPFAKSDSYSWQNEFRLLAEPIDFSLDPLVLNIGDISDISIIGSTDRLINEIKFTQDNQLYVPGYE
jgi:hypothetical protein